jgi:ribosome-associated translation inhibitor RaiA
MGIYIEPTSRIRRNATFTRYSQVTTPFQMTFRHLPHSEALASHVELRVARLCLISRRISAGHVVIDLVGHHPGCNHYRCSITVALPSHDIVVHHEQRGSAPESVQASADLVFDEAERQLAEWVRKVRAGRRTLPTERARPHRREATSAARH